MTPPLRHHCPCLRKLWQRWLLIQAVLSSAMCCTTPLQGVALRCMPCGALLLNAQSYRTHVSSKVCCADGVHSLLCAVCLHPAHRSAAQTAAYDPLACPMHTRCTCLNPLPPPACMVWRRGTLQQQETGHGAATRLLLLQMSRHERCEMTWVARIHSHRSPGAPA